MQPEKFLAYECVSLENETLKLLITKSIGPRILSFGFINKENLFAELPDFITEAPSGAYHFYGGHRLWHAPEDLARTYLPDDSPVKVSSIENGVTVTQDIEVKTGLQKSLEIVLDNNSVKVTHILTNCGLQDVTCAPWAITQFKTGGVAILPQTREDTGVLPNRSLVLWAYTNPADPNVIWGQDCILVNADMQSAFKIGFPNPRGWLAYWLNGTLFVKRAKYEAKSSYYDFGSSSEFYCSSQFLELETLAPIATLAPKQFVIHTETWELYANIERPDGNLRAIVDLIEKGR